MVPLVPNTLAVMVALPAGGTAFGLVYTILHVPLVVAQDAADKLPLAGANAAKFTVYGAETTLLLASLNTAVMFEVLVPFATSDAGSAVNVE
jgi:hypothetical protein